MERKILRNALRREAELKGYTQSAYVRAMFDHFQTKRVGRTLRDIHKAIGTKPKRLWRERILAVLPVKKEKKGV